LFAKPPYYRGLISADKIAQLRAELRFLNEVNPQVKFNWASRPGGFAVMTIYDEDILLNITTSDRFAGLGCYLEPFDKAEVDRLIKMVQKDTVLSPEDAYGYADKLWDHILQIVENYIPEEGQIVEDLSYD
jgi:hypothetical protein